MRKVQKCMQTDSPVRRRRIPYIASHLCVTAARGRHRTSHCGAATRSLYDADRHTYLRALDGRLPRPRVPPTGAAGLHCEPGTWNLVIVWADLRVRTSGRAEAE